MSHCLWPPLRLLMSMHHLPVAEHVAEGAAPAGGQRRPHGVTADGTMWIDHLVQFAQVLLSQPKHVESCQPFSAEQKQAWDRWGDRLRTAQ